MQAHFLTFADQRFRPSVDRLLRQAKSLDVFSTTIGASESDLTSHFRREFADRLQPSVRGFGYWVWKPEIIGDVLRQLPEGDLLLYCDAGSHLHAPGRARLLEYFSVVKDLSPILTFEFSETIGRWTKGDLLHYFGFTTNDPIVTQHQVAANTLVIRNTAEARAFIFDWRRVFGNWQLVDDTPSRVPNHPSFVEHRHDQSVLSLLARTRAVHMLNHSEQYPPTDHFGEQDWDALDLFPVHCRRDLQTCKAAMRRRRVVFRDLWERRR